MSIFFYLHKTALWLLVLIFDKFNQWLFMYIKSLLSVDKNLISDIDLVHE